MITTRLPVKSMRSVTSEVVELNPNLVTILAMVMSFFRQIGVVDWRQCTLDNSNDPGEGCGEGVMSQCGPMEEGQPEPWVSYECQGYPEEPSRFLVDLSPVAEGWQPTVAGPPQMGCLARRDE